MSATETNLHKLGITLCVVQTLLTCILPAVDYYYVYRFNKDILGLQAWTIWAVIAVIGLIGLIGFLAHGVGSSMLTLIHFVSGALFTASLAAYFIAWWFVLGSICAGCKAPGEEVCDPVHQNYTVLLLPFTGLAMVVFALPVLCLDFHVLMLSAARKAGRNARLAAIRVGVEQQNRLIAAGDKPTVTPGTLTDWVAILIAHGDATTKFVGEKCRAALRARGYELPVKGAGKKLAFKNEANIIQYIPLGSSIASLDEGPSEIIVTTASAGGSGTGGGSVGDNKRPKRQQVTPEESQVTQEASKSSYMIV